MQCYELCVMLGYLHRKIVKMAPDFVREDVLLSDMLHDAGIINLKSLLNLDKAQLDQIIRVHLPRYFQAA